MKNGYYLSTYLHINKLGYLLDLQGRHDQNISLWKKEGDSVSLIHYWELERVTGIKMFRKYCFDKDFASDIINKLLSEYGLSLNDINEVWGTPEFDGSEPIYHSLNDHPGLAYHAIAHLFSSMMMDTKKFYNETIVGLAVDGAPDGIIDKESDTKPYYVGCISRKGKVDMIPISSPGILWQCAMIYFKLREGTLMALASACQCSLEVDLPQEISLSDVNAYAEADGIIHSIVDQLQEKVKVEGWKDRAGYDCRFTEEENMISMVMKIVQRISLGLMEKNIDKLLQKYGVDPEGSYLSISGGYGLNCPTNSYLLKKYGFKGFMAPPCTSDTGMSLGIALYSFYKQMDKVDFELKHAYYGDIAQDLQGEIENGGYSKYIKSIQDYDVKQVVRDLQEAPVVWINGASEIGPRALGNRSILADPRKEESKNRLNEIKQRQWWRPVAPIVLEDDVQEWFEGACPSPYMLLTFEIRQEKLGKIPAVSHLDKSSRVQTINKEIDETGLYDVVRAFKEETGVPIICNTSLNDVGEPIINRIEEALNFALRKGIRIIYINKQRVELQNHEEYTIDTPLKRPLEWEIFSQEKKDALLEELNPYNLSKKEINIYINSNINPEFIDLCNKGDLRKLTVLTKAVEKLYGGYYSE